MTEFSWPVIRADAVAAFGDLPTAETETFVVEHFTKHPQLVINLIDEISADVKAGKVRSGWAILKSRLANFHTSAPNIRASSESERATAIDQAERWMANAGIHYDRADETLEHLFGPGSNGRGQLHAYADDTELRQRMTDLWAKSRPLGGQVEREAAERDEAWKASRKRPRVSDEDTGRRLISSLVADKVPLETIKRVIARAVNDDHLRTDLVAHATKLTTDDDIPFV